jgi:hypothetical protein
MMGDWNITGVAKEISQKTGVYGFHQGAMSFAFMEDGTAFIGKSGRGRILLDGNNSTISNDGYDKGLAGMLIDLDDAFISFKSDSEEKVYISKGYMETSGGVRRETPYFEINGSLSTLMHISDSESYL